MEPDLNILSFSISGLPVLIAQFFWRQEPLGVSLCLAPEIAVKGPTISVELTAASIIVSFKERQTYVQGNPEKRKATDC